MDNNSEKDELQVGQYDIAEAEKKKKRILTRVGIGVGLATLVSVLGYLGYTILRSYFMTEYIMGGSGAWFNSRVIYLGDDDG